MPKRRRPRYSLAADTSHHSTAHTAPTPGSSRQITPSPAERTWASPQSALRWRRQPHHRPPQPPLAESQPPQNLLVNTDCRIRPRIETIPLTAAQGTIRVKQGGDTAHAWPRGAPCCVQGELLTVLVRNSWTFHTTVNYNRPRCKPVRNTNFYLHMLSDTRLELQLVLAGRPAAAPPLVARAK